MIVMQANALQSNLSIWPWTFEREMVQFSECIATILNLKAHTIDIVDVKRVRDIIVVLFDM